MLLNRDVLLKRFDIGKTRSRLDINSAKLIEQNKMNNSTLPEEKPLFAQSNINYSS